MGGALAKASGLLLATLYLNPAYLAVADFGRLGALQTVAALFVPVLALGLTSGFVRFYAEDAGGDRSALAFTTLVMGAAVAVVGGGALWVAAPFVAERLVDMPEAAVAARMVVLYAAARSVGSVPLVYLQARERPGLYTLVQLAEFALLIGATAYLLVVRGSGLLGALGALTFSAVVTTVATSALVLRRVSWTFDPALARRLVRFGAPLVIGGLTLPFLHVGDRLLLGMLSSNTELAIYEAAARVAGVLNALLVQGFQVAFTVVGLKAHQLGGGGGLHRRTFRHFAAVGGGFVLGLTLLAPDVLRLLSRTDVYLAAAPLILPLAIGFLFYGLYGIAVNLLYAHQRTRRIGAWIALAAALNAGLNVVLIPRLGAMGAALATLLAYAVLAGSSARMAQRLEGFRFPWGALGATLVVVLVLHAGAGLARDLPLAGRLAVLLVLLAAYPPALLLARVYRPGEVRAAWTHVRRRLRPVRPGRAES